MTNEQLEQAIITVMVFYGWELKSVRANGVSYYENSECLLIFEYEILAKYPIHEDWRLLHTVWEKLSEKLRNIISSENEHTDKAIYYHNEVGMTVALSHYPPEAFTALHSAITWFNSINKKG